MNAAEVLSTLSVDSGKSEYGRKQGEGSGIDGTLFAMLLGSLLTNQGELKEQNEDVQGYALAGEMFGNGAYSQFLQRISPAGMEADSGKTGRNSIQDYLTKLTGELLLNPIQFQGTEADGGAQIVGDSNFLAGLADAVKTGSVATGSGEGVSLDFSELEKYIGILNQVEKLSGKLELKAGGEPRQSAQAPVNNQDQSGDSAFATVAIFSGEKSDDLTVKGNQARTDNQVWTENQAGTENQVRVENQLQAESQVRMDKQASTGDKDWTDSDSQAETNDQAGTDRTRADHRVQTDNSVQINNQALFKHNEAVLTALTNPAKLWAQVLEAVHAQRGTGNREVNEISLQLQPEELGKLHVSMKMENGQLHMIINASEQATGAFIQNHMAELKESLSQAGIECGAMQMGLGSENDKKQNWNDGQSGGRQFRAAEEQESARTFSMMGYGLSAPVHEQGSINVSV
ncbi:Flagellar hook-length control protein [Syntrophobotulus glycolicus DSM 8271]|uniref:Flagellar hook-length control protein n=1 Tax=Syntrophobotulus glycolicus (strain DSM 8271 / FlGlyR) TaxID=645991 RepID=F0SZX0_SYNGF|nr:flagellar hook-length control protein FliK [Syntrophobotulus glycolicus]ADY54981.1 Flagellar hook-length control protein [Syntrophobotulus glycolicus DSM 8271]